jgi:6-phosphogluconolactonase
MNVNLKSQAKFNLLVGTYTKTCESDGIYIFEFDAISGELKLICSRKRL